MTNWTVSKVKTLIKNTITKIKKAVHNLDVFSVYEAHSYVNLYSEYLKDSYNSIIENNPING